MIKKNYDIPKESFIGGYYIDKTICDNLVEYFNTNKERATRGCVGKGSDNVIDTESKDSLDLLIKYNDVHFPIYDYRMALHDCLLEYCKEFKELNDYSLFQISTDYNIQYYKPNEGFKAWHCERSGMSSSLRCLVFCTYLNDVEDGGTEFLYQNYTTKAEKGLTVLFPTDWTHTHRGQVTDKNEKYIITGWYSFIE